MDVIDEFLEFYKRNMPPIVYLEKNPKRYVEAKNAIKTVIRFVKNGDENPKIKVRPDPLTGTSLCLSVETELLIFDKELPLLLDAVKKADNLEICPLKTGKVLLSLSFDSVFRPAPPTEKAD